MEADTPDKFLLGAGVLEDLVGQGRIPSFSERSGGAGGVEYYAKVPPRRLGPGDVATFANGRWSLKDPEGRVLPYDYYPVSAGEREIIRRQTLILQVVQDSKAATT